LERLTIIIYIVLIRVRVLGVSVELEHFSVIFEELLGRCDLASAQLMLHIVLHEAVLLGDEFNLALGEIVLNCGFRQSLRVAEVFVKFSSV